MLQKYGTIIDMNRDNQRGFTLIEILIAITVFAIGLLAVGRMQVTAIKGNYFANDLTEATTLAQDRMEKLIGLSYIDDDLLDTNGNQDNGLDDTNATADHNDPNNPVDGRYNIFWNIATDHPIDNTKEIRVIVTWTDKKLPKKVSITSMKADII
jgi:type IV pilus assembly protein PilV